MAKAGRRKPRKRISSKSGASRVPKAATNQMSDEVRKNLSMGMFLGKEMREDIAWTVTDRMRPMGIRRRALRRAASRLAWMPSGKRRFQKSGERNQEAARVAR